MILETMQKSADWKIIDLYKKSFGLIKKNKLLWIFGIASGIGIGGLNSKINFADLENLQNLLKSQPAIPSSSQISQVLGVNTNVYNPALAFGQLFSEIPIYFWIILSIEVLSLFGIWLAVLTVLRTFSQAALIEGISNSLKGHSLTLSGSKKAFKSILPLIWLQIIPYLLILTAAMFFFGISIVGMSIGVLKILSVLIFCFSIIILSIGLLMISLSSIWAQREIVIDQKPAKLALILGFKIAMKKFWSTLFLGGINIVFTAVTMLISLAFLGFLAFYSFYDSGNFITLIFGGILFTISILGYTILGGIINAFKTSVWTIAYENIRGKYDSR